MDDQKLSDDVQRIARLEKKELKFKRTSEKLKEDICKGLGNEFFEFSEMNFKKDSWMDIRDNLNKEITVMFRSLMKRYTIAEVKELYLDTDEEWCINQVFHITRENGLKIPKARGSYDFLFCSRNENNPDFDSSKGILEFHPVSAITRKIDLSVLRSDSKINQRKLEKLFLFIPKILDLQKKYYILEEDKNNLSLIKLRELASFSEFKPAEDFLKIPERIKEFRPVYKTWKKIFNDTNIEKDKLMEEMKQENRSFRLLLKLE